MKSSCTYLCFNYLVAALRSNLLCLSSLYFNNWLDNLGLLRSNGHERYGFPTRGNFCSCGGRTRWSLTINGAVSVRLLPSLRSLVDDIRLLAQQLSTASPLFAGLLIAVSNKHSFPISLHQSQIYCGVMVCLYEESIHIYFVVVTFL